MDMAELAWDIDIVRAVAGNIRAGTTDRCVVWVQVKILQLVEGFERFGGIIANVGIPK
jgi:hypothetical protein